MMITLPNRVRWWQISSTEAPPLKSILQWCRSKQKVDTLLLSVRLSTNEQDLAGIDKIVEKTVEKLFGSNIREKFKAMGWPGTLLVMDIARIYIVEYNVNIENVILNAETDLFKWHHNHEMHLPEDLCLFKKGSSYPNLISVTHEKDAWLLCESDRPPFLGMKGTKMEESYIHDGPYFCATGQSANEKRNSN